MSNRNASSRKSNETVRHIVSPSLRPLKEDGAERRDSARDLAAHVFWLLVAFRLANAFVIRTFFQPDEYFQALEPAWQITFGEQSGSWITWEWTNRLRSTLYPYLFAGIYAIADRLALVFRLNEASRAELLIAAPKCIQGVLAAIGDYYTWQIGTLVYGESTFGSWFSLALNLVNPFHFFIATRTLSNCLESVLTSAALYLWFTSVPEDSSSTKAGRQSSPLASATDRSRSLREWQPHDTNLENIPTTQGLDRESTGIKTSLAGHPHERDVNRFRLCLILAATACVLRITNLLTWTFLATFEFVEYGMERRRHSRAGEYRRCFSQIRPRIRTMTAAHSLLIREVFFCGSLVLFGTAVLDKTYYGDWTFPPFRFLYFNIAEGISSFYGVNNFFWYFTQGLPLMLGLFVVFAGQEIYRTFSPNDPPNLAAVMKQKFAATAMVIPLVFSFVAHKEIRFIYPLLPILHVLAAGPASEYFRPVLSAAPFSRTDRKTVLRTWILVGGLFCNLLAALLITQYHQPAPLSVLDFIRHEHEAHYLTQLPAASGLTSAGTSMTVGFLMPCHSTPWRSHLVHPTIKAWALGCEPPIGKSTAEKAVYRDEADRFYDDPINFLTETLGNPATTDRLNPRHDFGLRGQDDKQMGWNGRSGRKEWPDYLVFFSEKERLLSSVLKDADYFQCWRGWNTWFHDDWRRRGDIVVWCHRQRSLYISR